MPYIVVKCGVNEIDTGVTYFGDKTTDAVVVHSLGRTWYSNRGFYVVHEPPCWVLNKLEEHGYVAAPPLLHGPNMIWVAHRPLVFLHDAPTNKNKNKKASSRSSAIY